MGFYFVIIFLSFLQSNGICRVIKPIINQSLINFMKNLLQLQTFVCLLCFAYDMTYGQSDGKIKGEIQFPAGTELIVVELLTSENNTLVKTELTESDGSFTFNGIGIGNYIINIDDEKYSPYQSDTISLTSQQPEMVLPKIILKITEVNKLGEVVIEKKKQVVENKIDRTIVNVDAMISVAGGDAMDVLQKSPGITVDQNGTITFKGKSGVAVFIDDKPTYLSGSELEAYLKSLPASTLSQIELITNPPAKYDAAGSAGIINIITKKSKARGFNGSFSSRVSQGKRTNTRQGLNLNYLDNKIRLFGNIGYAYQETVNDLYIFRRFLNEDLTTKSYFDQDSYLTGKANTGNARAGIDYYLNEKTTFGASVSGLIKDGDRKSDVESELSNAAYVLDSTIVANNSTQNRFSNIGVNFNFRRELEKGRKITADADYLNYTSNTDQRFKNFIYQPDGTLSGQDEAVGELPSRIDIVSLKTDYSHPMKNDGLFEAGYKISISKTDNVADYNDVVEDVTIPNYDISNHFKYDEIVNAAYVNFNTSYKRFTFQTGLRLENTDSKGNQLGNIMKPASTFHKNYTNLFPTVYVQYKLDSVGDNQLVTSYGKRINRPYYEDLNPFISPLDKFTFYSGNPYLDPSFAHNVELSYRYKGYFSTALSYGFTKDDIAETIEINEGIYFSRPGNIGKSHIYSLNMNAQIPFAKWLSTTLYSEVTYSKFESKLYTEDLNSSGTYWYGSIVNMFQFSKDWSGELMGYYQTTVVSSQFELGPRGQVSIGVQKKILKGQGSIKLSGNDIFYGSINNGTINNLHLTEATWVNKPDSRFVALIFTYSFGKAFEPKDQHDASGADSEKNRVKSN
jgi:hypothetical protein